MQGAGRRAVVAPRSVARGARVSGIGQRRGCQRPHVKPGRLHPALGSHPRKRGRCSALRGRPRPSPAALIQTFSQREKDRSLPLPHCGRGLGRGTCRRCGLLVATRMGWPFPGASLCRGSLVWNDHTTLPASRDDPGKDQRGGE